MAKFLVQKSAPLHGEVKISGSKNAVLPIMAAALLTEEKCEIKDVPALRDVQVMCKLLESLGDVYKRQLLQERCKSLRANGSGARHAKKIENFETGRPENEQRLLYIL